MVSYQWPQLKITRRPLQNAQCFSQADLARKLPPSHADIPQLLWLLKLASRLLRTVAALNDVLASLLRGSQHRSFVGNGQPSLAKNALKRWPSMKTHRTGRADSGRK